MGGNGIEGVMYFKRLIEFWGAIKAGYTYKTSLQFINSVMEMMIMGGFVDIAEFTLTGEEEFVTIEIIPVSEDPVETFDQFQADLYLFFDFLIQLSVGQVEMTGNLLTPCFYFTQECQEMDSSDEFDLDGDIQIQQMILEEIYQNQESQDEDKPQESTIGYDLLDILQKQYEKLLVEKETETCKNDILSSSTSVNGQTNTHKSEDFEICQFQENLDYHLETRRDKVQRYLKKRKNRNWNKKISYKCRKQVADSRLRIKGRFITRQQASVLLGVNTNNMSIDLIRTLLESKYGKQKDSQVDDMSDKHHFIFAQ